MIGQRTMLSIAAAFMLLDAVGYSLGALGPIRRALRSDDPYWNRRLTLNLLLANQGLYFAGVAATLGAIYVDTQSQAANAIEVLCLLTCIYTVVTVTMLTPKDWPHVLPRGIAGVLILIAFVVG